MKVIAPSTAPRAISGTTITEPMPQRAQDAQVLLARAAIRTSSSSVTCGITSARRLRITTGAPIGSSRSGGQPSTSRRARSCISGSGWTMESRRTAPSASTTSTMHQAPSSGSAKPATVARVVS